MSSCVPSTNLHQNVVGVTTPNSDTCEVVVTSLPTSTARQPDQPRCAPV